MESQEQPSPELIAQQLRKPSGEAGVVMGEKMNDGNQHLHRFVVEGIDIKDGAVVLEAGFGNGKFIAEIFEKTPNVKFYGIDYSETMVQEAGKNNQQLIDEGKVVLEHASLDAIPYSDNTFDHFFTVNTLYFWENPPLVLKEIKRVLKPGGSLHIGIRPKSNLTSLTFIQHGFTLYEIEDVVAMLKEANFKSIEHHTQQEPEIEFNGEKMKVESLHIQAIK